MNGSRLWLAAVVAAFCLPLFIGLDRDEIDHDEAIYSFAVDKMLETGDWLRPIASPSEDVVFLEKPPLKFWIVAAPIRLGLFPHNDFGLRFWDAAFGGAAFLYIFLIGSRLAGPLCGAAAVFLLFVHEPLLFVHGLRGNQMEAPLVLAYCGGVYHFLSWARLKAGTTYAAGLKAGTTYAGQAVVPTFRWADAKHPFAVALYFVLGFMTKFVAALFLPVILGAAALAFADTRRALLANWGTWVVAAALAAALIAPWFVWGHFAYGSFFWQIIFATHVFERFTTALDPSHVQPWDFYARRMFEEFSASGSAVIVIGGLVALLVVSIRRRWVDGLLIVLWLTVPIVLISLGTSKLYHYAYPFLPAAGLAGGYLLALVVLIGVVPLRRAFSGVCATWRGWLPGFAAACARPGVRHALLAVAALALGAAFAVAVSGPIRLRFDGLAIRSSSVVRPALVAVVLGLLANTPRGVSRAVAWLVVFAALPFTAYPSTIARATSGTHPMRATRECVARVQTEVNGRGLYWDVPLIATSHPLYYHFRRLRPVVKAETATPEAIGPYLYDASVQRPVLVWEPTYRDFWNASGSDGPPEAGGRTPAMAIFKDAIYDVFLLLPGPYAVCANAGLAANTH